MIETSADYRSFCFFSKTPVSSLRSGFRRFIFSPRTPEGGTSNNYLILFYNFAKNFANFAVKILLLQK
jgi:hypothetical protein